MTIDEKIEYELDLAKLAQLNGNKRKYSKHIIEIRRLTKEKEAK